MKLYLIYFRINEMALRAPLIRREVVFNINLSSVFVLLKSR